jgi:myo-inositol-1(or 4)-monophosphatase
MEDYQRELNFAKDLAQKAGGIILKNFFHSKITVKSNLTPVTETDIAISQMVITEVKKNFPEHSILDEELQNKKDRSEFLWVCDPVDGTIPFAHHIPTSMFSLALCQKGEPVVAVIYDPFMKRLLYTKKNSPTLMNGKAIRVAEGHLKKGDFIFGIPYWNREFNTNRFFDLITERNIRVTYVESIVYQSMLVASGVTKALVIIAAMPWDRAAAKMIVENAGGKCTDERGGRLPVFGNPKYFVATNGIVHQEMLELLNKSMSK